MSFYAQDCGASDHKNNVKTGSPGKQKTIDVPIFEESNLGVKMAINEKHIAEDFYTIITNRDTGKIAMLCNSYNFTGLERVLVGHPSVLSKVESIALDFSASYQKQCDRLFPDAVQVEDKVNVIRHLIEVNQAIRIKIRQKEVQKRREAFNEFKGAKNYGWKNEREMEKNLSSGNSTTRKHGMKMRSPRWNCWPGTGTCSSSSSINGNTLIKDKGQCLVSFLP